MDISSSSSSSSYVTPPTNSKEAVFATRIARMGPGELKTAASLLGNELRVRHKIIGPEQNEGVLTMLNDFHALLSTVPEQTVNRFGAIIQTEKDIRAETNNVNKAVMREVQKLIATLPPEAAKRTEALLKAERKKREKLIDKRSTSYLHTLYDDLINLPDRVLMERKQVVERVSLLREMERKTSKRSAAAEGGGDEDIFNDFRKKTRKYIRDPDRGTVMDALDELQQEEDMKTMELELENRRQRQEEVALNLLKRRLDSTVTAAVNNENKMAEDEEINALSEQLNGLGGDDDDDDGRRKKQNHFDPFFNIKVRQ